jgi:hypothetical protein
MSDKQIINVQMGNNTKIAHYQAKRYCAEMVLKHVLHISYGNMYFDRLYRKTVLLNKWGIGKNLENRKNL